MTLITCGRCGGALYAAQLHICAGSYAERRLLRARALCRAELALEPTEPPPPAQTVTEATWRDRPPLL